MNLKVSEIAEMCGGRLVGSGENTVTSFYTDSRETTPGKMFVPIRGENTDAHRFIPQVFASGAAATFSEEPLDAPAGDVVYVENTRAALQKVAERYRERFNIPVIGITGSVGKTTTKEMVALAVSAGLKTMKTAGNANSQIGLPMTVLRITPEDAPLETAQELQALLDRLAEEYDADTSITVELPDVTYDAPVSVGCAVTLKGSGTTFAAPVTVTPLNDTERCHAYVRFSEASFEGDGSGTGVTARAPTYLENCRVTGWDVGALAVNGGWVYLHGGYIGGNGVGARYDSAYSNSYTYTIRHIDFLNNTTALELLCLPPNSYAALDDCRFRGNGTDVYNPGGYRIEVNNGTEVTL